MKAAIDIGTNTVLLLIGTIHDGKLNVVREEYRIPRLGKGVDESKSLHADSMQRVLNVLNEYNQILEKEYPNCKEVIVTATSAVRDAQNRNEFLHRIKSETGFEVRLLSGDDEAIYTYGGALAPLKTRQESPYVVLDIGGGSTEIALGEGFELSHYTSIDMGCVRFTERFLKGNPPSSDEIEACRIEIDQLLKKQHLSINKNTSAVGVAGTVTTLAAMEMESEVYEPELINGYKLSIDQIRKSIEVFSSRTFDELILLSPVALKGRVDIFLAGLLILEGFLKYYNLTEIVVSTGGIRHGTLLISEKD